MSIGRAEAEALLAQAGGLNPGSWVAHSMLVAHAALRIATAADLDDPDRAYTLGLLHDIGRRYGPSHIKHATDGYGYLLRLGFSDHAAVCLSHSFPTRRLESYFGTIDIGGAELRHLERYLSEAQYTDYDKLIQLCDHLASARGYCVVEQRMVDVALRYGVGDVHREKWAEVIRIRQSFDSRVGGSVYSFLPGVAPGTFQTGVLLAVTPDDPEYAVLQGAAIT